MCPVLDLSLNSWNSLLHSALPGPFYIREKSTLRGENFTYVLSTKKFQSQGSPTVCENHFLPISKAHRGDTVRSGKQRAERTPLASCNLIHRDNLSTLTISGPPAKPTQTQLGRDSLPGPPLIQSLFPLPGSRSSGTCKPTCGGCSGGVKGLCCI